METKNIGIFVIALIAVLSLVVSSIALNGLNDVEIINGIDGKDGTNGINGIDCTANQPPIVNIYYCGDGIVSHGEGCDDGNHISGDGCDNDCYTDWDILVGVTDPEEEIMTIDIYYKFGEEDNWILYNHLIEGNGYYKARVEVPTKIDIIYWCAEVSDGSNLVFKMQTTLV